LLDEVGTGTGADTGTGTGTGTGTVTVGGVTGDLDEGRGTGTVGGGGTGDFVDNVLGAISGVLVGTNVSPKSRTC